MEPFYIYTYIHIYIYIYNKVIFQNKKLIPVQSKSKRDRVRHFQGALEKDRPWSWGVGSGQGVGRSCLCVRECVRVRICLSVWGRENITLSQEGCHLAASPGEGGDKGGVGRLGQQGLLLLPKLSRFLRARQLCECE